MNKGNEGIEPETGLRFIELSHPWGHGAPVWPGDPDVHIERSVIHATHGVMSEKVIANMHVSTHVNAPIYLLQRGQFIGDLPPDLFFGNGVILSVPKGKWQLVTAADLEQVGTDVQSGDIVLIVTGWGERFSDSQDYFGNAPGLAPDAAEWLVAKGVKLVGVDMAAVDHPLSTSLGLHRGGPTMRRLPKRYQDETGNDPRTAFPDWNPAARILLSAGIPTILNVGGDVATLLGQRVTIHAMPWRWLDGEAAVIRLMAIIDTTGTYRIEPGHAA